MSFNPLHPHVVTAERPSTLTLQGEEEIISNHKVLSLLNALKEFGIEIFLEKTEPQPQATREKDSDSNMPECEICGESMRVVRNYHGIYDIVCCSK